MLYVLSTAFLIAAAIDNATRSTSSFPAKSGLKKYFHVLTLLRQPRNNGSRTGVILSADTRPVQRHK